MPQSKITSRAPIIAVVGHIDHGKSTLLDYIRSANVVAGEAGGITQRLSAYEVAHKTKEGEVRRITFLDTPGHAAFQKMRSRGLEVADIAILVVSAEEGVKPQTLEAIGLIKDASLPYIVAITKIDKAGANVEKTKNSLIENEIYLEGMGGDVPFVPISSKSGQGIEDLLDLILLVADLKGLMTNTGKPGEGTVIEANVDPRKGTSATLIIRTGRLEQGMYVVAGGTMAPVRIMENFLGKNIKEASAGSPVRIVGFSSLPEVGETFQALESKKEAEALALTGLRPKVLPKVKIRKGEQEEEEPKPYLPVVIKTDALGIADAIEHEIEKARNDKLEVRVVSRGVGSVSEGDVKLAGGGSYPGIIVGFNVTAETAAGELAERTGVEIALFDIIYKLAEWMEKKIEQRAPKEEVEEIIAVAKILKIFSEAKGKIVLGGKVESGALKEGATVRISRREGGFGQGIIVSLQTGKLPVKSVEVGNEFGAMIKSADPIAPGDKLECVTSTLK